MGGADVLYGFFFHGYFSEQAQSILSIFNIQMMTVIQVPFAILV